MMDSSPSALYFFKIQNYHIFSESLEAGAAGGDKVWVCWRGSVQGEPCFPPCWI